MFNYNLESGCCSFEATKLKDMIMQLLSIYQCSMQLTGEKTHYQLVNNWTMCRLLNFLVIGETFWNYINVGSIYPNGTTWGDPLLYKQVNLCRNYSEFDTCQYIYIHIRMYFAQQKRKRIETTRDF